MGKCINLAHWPFVPYPLSNIQVLMIVQILSSNIKAYLVHHTAAVVQKRLVTVSFIDFVMKLVDLNRLEIQYHSDYSLVLTFYLIAITTMSLNQQYQPRRERDPPIDKYLLVKHGYLY